MNPTVSSPPVSSESNSHLSPTPNPVVGSNTYNNLNINNNTNSNNINNNSRSSGATNNINNTNSTTTTTTSGPCRPTGRSSRCCRDNCGQRFRGWKIEEPGGPKLWRQMVIGFVSAACVGLIMFSLGSIFISEAVRSKISITIMLCIMGMVCGAIILVGVVILGKLFISRDWRRPPQPTHACFQTCSVVYTHSQDQISPVFLDPPPAYDTIACDHHTSIGMVDLGRSSTSDTILTTVDIHRDGRAVILSPPKYSDVATPLPSYESALTE